VFATPRYQLNVSEAASDGAAFSLPVAVDADAGVNGRVEYRLRAARPAGGSDDISGGGGVFRLVQGVDVADGSTEVTLVLQSPLDREQVLAPGLCSRYFYRSVSGTGNRHPILMDRVPAVAMNGWHVASPPSPVASVKMASTLRRFVIWRSDFLFFQN